MVRLLLIGVFAAVMLHVGAGGGSVSAHANLTRSTPADGAVVLRSPAEIVFVFSEPVVVEQGIVQVADATGVQRDNGDFHHHGDATNPGISVAPDLPDGLYTVTWDVPSATDGHRTSGTFGFTVGSSPVRSANATANAQATDVEPDESGGSALILILGGAFAGVAVLGAVVVVLMRRRG